MIQHTNTYLHDSNPVQTYGVTRSSLYTIYTLLVLVYAGSVALCLVVLVIQKQPGDPWYHSFLGGHRLGIAKCAHDNSPQTSVKAQNPPFSAVYAQYSTSNWKLR